jgi:Tfp pilus assembly protein PilN
MADGRIGGGAGFLMHLNINLATNPYQDARRFWMQWGTTLALVGILTLALLAITVTGWFNAKRDRQTISQLKSQISERDAERAKAEAYLNLPANRSTRDRSQFLNELIQRKAFSWTKVFEELEAVMPPRLHVVSIHPEPSQENQLAMKIVVAGDSRDRAITLARKMEDSKHFRDTRITQEQNQQGQTNGDNSTFDIDAIYVPSSQAGSVP